MPREIGERQRDRGPRRAGPGDRGQSGCGAEDHCELAPLRAPSERRGEVHDHAAHRPLEPDPWAALLRRVSAADVLHCPRCGGRRRSVAVHTRPETLRPLLERLGLAIPGPAAAPSRSPRGRRPRLPRRATAPRPPRPFAVVCPPAPRPRRTARLFWVGLARLWAGWRQSLVIVTPDTVLRWQRRRFRKHWTQLSGRTIGSRPPINAEIRALITAVRVPAGR